jgi:hypothetical protein
MASLLVSGTDSTFALQPGSRIREEDARDAGLPARAISIDPEASTNPHLATAPA